MSDVRRPPRPTVKFLRLLPTDSFADPRQAAAIAEKQWETLRFGDVVHPLITDAAKQFAAGAPDRHVSASKAAKRPVFEVRSRTGAAWRGAVVLDKQGDPWLVWAAKHNTFHNQVADVLKDVERWLPEPVELKLRAREEAAKAHLVWRRDATVEFLDAVARAVEELSQGSTCELPRFGGQPPVSIEIELDHDLPSGRPEKDNSMLTVLVRVGNDASDDFIRFVLPSIQPDAKMIDSTYTVDHSHLDCWITLSQSRLAQIVAARELSPSADFKEGTCLPVSHRHYVAKVTLADSLVLGNATRAICGCWFVPTRDELAPLPVCPECELVYPAAQITEELIRRALDVQS